MRALISSGIRVNARVSHQLIQTIFHPNTPLHDGAIAIQDNEIVAAHIIFPLTQSVALRISREVGTDIGCSILVTTDGLTSRARLEAREGGGVGQPGGG